LPIKKTSQRKQFHIGRKFAESGHPDRLVYFFGLLLMLVVGFQQNEALPQRQETQRLLDNPARGQYYH
jgi:hypothetical protein